ncbi:MAG TPA: hypothetical protein VIT85_01685 [Solirubrobacterales bacterium]
MARADVDLVFVPGGTTVAELADRGLAPGLMSAGLGSVPPAQTYLDITQGNRVFDSLYDTQLHPLGPDCEAWPAVLSRADSAPADIVPGILQSELRAAGIGVRVGGGASCTFSAPRPEAPAGAVSPEKLSGAPHPDPAPTFEVRNVNPRRLPALVRNLHGDDLLVAIERPPPDEGRALAIGIAGRGFEGDLTSDSTRLDGYVLSTDVAPTVLERLGVAVPSEMSGRPIGAEGAVDAASIESLGDRMAAIPDRRGPVIGFALLAWIVALALASVLGGERLARPAVRLAGLAIVYLPLMLLLGAALESSTGFEQLLVILGAPLLAAATLAALGGYRALGVASAATVLAYAVDMIAGSPLTSLSLLGPNPGLGVRFYGIGNELEALLAVLVVAGTGAALTGFRPSLAPRPAAAVFLTVGLLAAFVFAAGRFGADVGAAIVFPLGAAVAAAVLAASSRRTALLIVATPILAVGTLALIDLFSGADAHLTRSVLDAGGLGDLADVAQRRLQLSAHSFSRPIVFVFLPLIIAVAVLAFVWRERIAAWLVPRPSARAGLAGALVATVAGTLANDSGALLLEIGSAYLLVFLGYAWAAR